MRVLIKFTDAEGKEYVYTNRFYSSMFGYEGWRIPITGETTYQLAMVLDDWDENIFHIEELARQHNCKMEVIPVQNILGTYLSTPGEIGGICDELYNKFMKIYIFSTPIIILLICLYIILR